MKVVWLCVLFAWEVGEGGRRVVWIDCRASCASHHPHMNMTLSVLTPCASVVSGRARTLILSTFLWFVADIEGRDAEEFKPIHVLNLETTDNNEDAIKKSQALLQLCKLVNVTFFIAFHVSPLPPVAVHGAIDSFKIRVCGGGLCAVRDCICKIIPAAG